MNKNKKQSGFSAVEGLLILILVGLVSFIGYYVWNANKESSDISTPQTTTSNKSATVTKTTKFTDKDNVYSLQLPENWQAKYLEPVANTSNASASEPFSGSFLTIIPGDFKAIEGENTWVASIVVVDLSDKATDLDGNPTRSLAELKKSVLNASADKNAINKDLVINGAKAWRHEENFKDHSATGPPEVLGGYRDVTYYISKDDEKGVILTMRVYQHESTNYQGTKISSAYNYTKYLPQVEAIAKSINLN